jgi:deoxyribodipyrimidine photolyase-related protein
MERYTKLLVVQGNQLFPLDSLRRHKDAIVYLSEDCRACTYLQHHKHKLVLILSAMRAYADALRKAGFTVVYEKLEDHPASSRYTDRLGQIAARYGCRKLVHFEMQDKNMARRMENFAASHNLQHRVLPSPMFLTPRESFAAWRAGQKQPRMVDFYKWQRSRLNILIEDNGKPTGDRWSFDADNRNRLPASMPVPELPAAGPNPHLDDVKVMVARQFAEHPGSVDNFALPTTRRAALDWLNDFLEQRFTCFGDYEDALTTRSDHVFHSVLSPLLNIGLLTPEETVRAALDFAKREEITLNNVEGFVRQLIGWREFMFGIYCTDGDEMRQGNFWNHHRRLRADWYRGTTGMTPLDSVIDKANRIGWAHHIERLMIAGNAMVLAEVHPDEVYRWFMELFVDAADWVMVPNVYGMALFADGGTITTKPYVCGSNYLRKMGDYEDGDWNVALDGLFWRFIAKHRRFFEQQPRLRMLCGHLDRQSAERRAELLQAARKFLDGTTDVMPEVA